MTCAQRMRAIQSNSSEKTEDFDDPDFAETVELSFKYGPPSLRPWSRFVKFLVNFFICLTQLGFCCIYFVFIADNFQQVCAFSEIDFSSIHSPDEQYLQIHFVY